MNRRRALLACATAVPFARPAWAQGAAEEAVAERRVKAAYLFRFANYVEWPESVLPRPDSPLVIAVWGHDELAEDLGVLVAARTVGERRVEVHRFKEGAALSGIHILFAGRTRTARLAEVLGGPEPRPMLVVTESPGALRQGSVINFLLEDGQIRFEVSPEAAERRGLKLSSRLIAVSQNMAGRFR